jgi:hypothetical protein
MVNAAYVAIFTFLLASGEKIETEEEVYPSREECLLNAEAEAKSMDRQWQWEERKTGQPRFFRGVEVRCEKRTSRSEKRENYGY